MDAYGGVGLKAVQEWDDTPLSTVSWLMGCRLRRIKPQDAGPDPIGGLTTEDKAILNMLNGQDVEALRAKFKDRMKPK